ncbi:PAS domain-containing protein [Xylocopilactobacillus apicola]|uniref:Uncharacterized protein n=1 Tax=Xylocopilactobacillus apicola TaxID=2932184 RepID=A0AAU9D529_9LACO|nr:PAS domain-containing protein [Xylocopilactobacillus apicola]BDR58588.1 hypothetical protein XA3_10290 [Xylocopilactobacillus apicola]
MEQIDLTTGSLNLSQLQNIFRIIPQEFDFIDEKDIIRWYSNNSERIFDREPSALNKHVLDVHPSKSADRIIKLLDQMHNGTVNEQVMVIPAKGKQIQISFYAVKDENEKYLGCIEVTQDVSHLVGKTKLGHMADLIKKRFSKGSS